MFFEEILDRFVCLPDSVILGFSELHLTFQKFVFLLQDCTHEGSGIFILMKSHFVASQFRMLIRALSTALEVIPLNSIEISGEIKELVELVAKQSEKSKVEVDSEDEDAVKRVILVLNQFENRLKPEAFTIKKVLDYLEIRTWSDCQKEVKFLEKEIWDLSDGEDQEFALLSSLIGFLSYCRCVLFEESDYLSSDESDNKLNLETLGPLNPEDFRCPISLELMIDPVTVSTGQTYDRSSIQKWLRSGNLICPKTGEKLKTTDLVPNSALRKLIHQFCVDNGISLSKSTKQNRDISRTIAPGSASAAEAVRSLAEFLACRLCFGSNEQKIKAAYEMRLLAKSNIYNRFCLINAGTIPPLLGMLCTKNPTMQENAISALLKLSKQSSGKIEIMEQGGWKRIIWALKHGLKTEVKQIAAATCFYLSSVHEYRRKIGETPDAFHALAKLIKEGNNCGRKNALAAMFGLLLHRDNHKKVVEVGAIPILVDLLASSDKDDLKTDALAVLATLSESLLDCSFEILLFSCLPLIIGLFQTITTGAGKEYCVSILLSLCMNGGADVVSRLATDSSLMPSLYSVMTQGTNHACKKARLLIKILHRYTETSSTCFIGEFLQQQEQLVDLC